MIQAIIGKKGQGKTTLIKQILKKWIKNTIIFDVSEEYKNIPGFISVQKYGQFKKIFLKNNYKIVFDLTRPEHIKYFIPFIMTGNNSIFFDESHTIIKEPSIMRLIRLSRNRDIDLFFVSHRIYDFPLILRGNLDKLILFKIQSLADLDYIKKYISEIEIKIVRDLERFNYLEIDMDKDIILKKSLTFK